MKRRNFLIRMMTGAAGATVFTAAGWLMGTRSLSMEVPPGYHVCDSQTCVYQGSTCYNYGGTWYTALWYTCTDYYYGSYCGEYFVNTYSTCRPN